MFPRSGPGGRTTGARDSPHGEQAARYSRPPEEGRAESPSLLDAGETASPRGEQRPRRGRFPRRRAAARHPDRVLRDDLGSYPYTREWNRMRLYLIGAGVIARTHVEAAAK